MFKVGDRVVCIDNNNISSTDDEYILYYHMIYIVTCIFSNDTIKINDRRYIYSNLRFISLKRI